MTSTKPLTNQPSPVVGQVDGTYDAVSSPNLPRPKCDKSSGDINVLACKELQGDTWQRALYDKMCWMVDGGKDEGHG